MTEECTYCGETVPDDAYVDHLRGTHRDELSVIDRRRVGEAHDSSDGGSNTVLYAGVGAVLTVFVVGYVVLFFGLGSESTLAAVQPDSQSQIHEHGTIFVEHDGETVTFDDSQYLERDGCFHFHGTEDPELWHAHCEDVTIEYALATLGMEVTEDSLVVDGEEYHEDDPDTTVSVTVNGDPVDPEEHVLEGVDSVDDAQDDSGDAVRIVAERGG